MIALGSRGDVQPFVALGRRIVSLGHSVVIAAAEDYEPLVREYGLPFASLGGRIADYLDPELIYGILDHSNNPLYFARRTLEIVRPLVSKLVEDCYNACVGADSVLASTLGVYLALDVASALHLPLAVAHVHPYGPTGAYPHVSFPTMPHGVPGRRLYHRATYYAAEFGFWQLLGPLVNRSLTGRLGLKGASRLSLARRAAFGYSTTLLSYSVHVAPRPRDWPSTAHITGYWHLDEPHGWEPPGDLARFLAAGPPPVYVCFGSTLAGRDPDAVTRLIIRALESAGVRGIIASGWGDLGNIELPDSVLRTENVPYSRLFRHVTTIVTHAGAGSVEAALRAGLPIVTVPFYGDQRFWSKRVRHLGAGPQPIPRAQLTESRLAAAITQALSEPQYRERSSALGAMLLQEDGVGAAANLLVR